MKQIHLPARMNTSSFRHALPAEYVSSDIRRAFDSPDHAEEMDLKQ